MEAKVRILNALWEDDEEGREIVFDVDGTVKLDGVFTTKDLMEIALETARLDDEIIEGLGAMLGELSNDVAQTVANALEDNEGSTLTDAEKAALDELLAGANATVDDGEITANAFQEAATLGELADDMLYGSHVSENTLPLGGGEDYTSVDRG